MEQKAAASTSETGQEFPWSREKTRQYVESMSRKVEVKGYLLTKILLGGFVWFIRKLSWEGADRLGTLIGKALYMFGIRRKEAMINLDIAFGDSRTREEKETIYRGCMINLGRHILNYMRVPLMDERFWSDFEIENEQLLRDAYNRGKGVIFVGGHIGVWEFAAGRAGMAGYPISIVAKRVQNPVVDKLIVDARLGMNLGTVPHRDSMERVMEGLRRGEGVIMAVDQNMKRSQGVFVEWMGRIASTVRSNAWVARETGAPVVAGYAHRVSPGRYKLIIPEEVPWEPHPEEPEKELLINTRNQARAVEKIILENPEMWLWIHRRWKVQPEGVPNPYE